MDSKKANLKKAKKQAKKEVEQAKKAEEEKAQQEEKAKKELNETLEAKEQLNETIQQCIKDAEEAKKDRMQWRLLMTSAANLPGPSKPEQAPKRWRRGLLHGPEEKEEGEET